MRQTAWPLGAALLLAAGAASAGDGTGVPVSFADRGPTLPRNVISPEIGLTGTRTDAGVTGARGGFDTAVGAHFGVTDDVVAGVLFAPITWAPLPVSYGDPRLDVALAYHHGRADLAASLAATFRVASGGGLTLEPGLPAVFHLGQGGRLDAGAYFPITFGGSDPTWVGARFPVALAWNLTAPVYLGVQSALEIGNLARAGATLDVPLGISGGYTLADEGGAILDIAPFLRWPRFATPGSDRERLGTGVFQVGMNLALYLHL